MNRLCSVRRTRQRAVLRFVTMKAIRVHQPGGPEVLKLEEVPEPVPGRGQVLIKLHAVGVNPVETYIRSGNYGQKQWPYTPGADGAGTVEAIGEGVRKVKPGDRVYTAGSVTGTYAEKAVCPEARVFRLPENVSFAARRSPRCPLWHGPSRAVPAGHVLGPAKRSSSTAPAAASASRPSNSPGHSA